MSDIKERLALECPRRSVDVADHSLCQPDSLCVACAALDRLAALERELAEAKRSDVAQAIRASKAEAALRQRHAEAVKSAYIEGRNSDEFDAADKFIEDEYSWLASEAKARLT